MTGGEIVKEFNKKNLANDWKVCLIALIAGLIIAAVAWCLTHLSFILTWMTITIASIPVWRQIAEWAQKRYPHYLFSDALFAYIIMNDDNYEDENNDNQEVSLDD